MPKVKLLIDGPYPYSDKTYQRGDVFYVGPAACDMGVREGTMQFLEADPPPEPPDVRTPEEKISALQAENASLRAKVDELTVMLEEATK